MTETTPLEISHRDSRDRPSFRNNTLLRGIGHQIYDELADTICNRQSRILQSKIQLPGWRNWQTRQT